MNKLYRFLLGCVCTVFAVAALAQSVPPAAAPDPLPPDLQGVNLNEERARIKQVREAALQAYRQAIKVCYQQIAVNACKMDAQQKKNTIDNDLRRQELLLNNYQRQQRADKAVQRLEDKQSADAQTDAEDKRIEFHNSHLDKLQENLDKNDAYLEKQEQVERNRENYQKKLDELNERQRKQQDKASEAQKKRAEYQRKLDEADKHRQQVDNDNANRKPTAPLPVPRAEDIPQ